MSFLDELRDKRRKFLDGLEANREDIKLDIFKDFYPDKAHFIYELLQNAEDTRASEVSFLLSEQSLWFEHDGRPFDEEDIRTITGIGVGTKSDDDDKIGDYVGKCRSGALTQGAASAGGCSALSRAG